MQPMENKIVFDERSFQRIEKKEKDLGTVYHRSLWKDIVSEIKSNPVAIFAVIFLIIIIVASLLAPLSPEQVGSGKQIRRSLDAASIRL